MTAIRSICVTLMLDEIMIPGFGYVVLNKKGHADCMVDEFGSVHVSYVNFETDDGKYLGSEPPAGIRGIGSGYPYREDLLATLIEPEIVRLVLDTDKAVEFLATIHREYVTDNTMQQSDFI